jgi:hypothetical protein
MVSTKLRRLARAGSGVNPTRAQLVLRGLLAGGLAFSMVVCAPSSHGGGSADTTGSGGAGATTAGSSSSAALGPWALTVDYPLAAKNCSGTSPYLSSARAGLSGSLL